MAAQRGARVAGIDAAAALITIAQERVPGGDFRAGEMEALPYADNTFDVITGFNSFQYAANPMNALHEARRVGRPGAQVVMTTWGRPEDCETAAYLAALRPLASPAPPGAPGPFSLSAAGALEALVARAGLTPTDAADVDCPFVYPDLETALRGLLSAGPAVKAIQTSGEERVREAIGNVLEAFKNTAGHYRIANTFRYLIARIE
jgi:SAM-dependent methyltransferase